MKNSAYYFEDTWTIEMKNELLNLIKLYKSFCEGAQIKVNIEALPNWFVFEKAIETATSPETLLMISDKLVEVNNSIMGLSKSVYVV